MALASFCKGQEFGNHFPNNVASERRSCRQGWSGNTIWVKKCIRASRFREEEEQVDLGLKTWSQTYYRQAEYLMIQYRFPQEVYL